MQKIILELSEAWAQAAREQTGDRQAQAIGVLEAGIDCVSMALDELKRDLNRRNHWREIGYTAALGNYDRSIAVTATSIGTILQALGAAVTDISRYDAPAELVDRLKFPEVISRAKLGRFVVPTLQARPEDDENILAKIEEIFDELGSGISDQAEIADKVSQVTDLIEKMANQGESK